MFIPYIKRERRKAIFSQSKTDFNSDLQNAGELNYFITELIQEYVLRQGLCYQTINDVSGAMTESLAEFRRRVVGPYEDLKIKENSDCYSKKLLQKLKKQKKQKKWKRRIRKIQSLPEGLKSNITKEQAKRAVLSIMKKRK